MAIHVLGFPTRLGIPREESLSGPTALRRAGLIAYLQRFGQPVVDHGDMDLPPGRREEPPAEKVRKVVAAARRQKELWRQSGQKPGDLMLTIGGDHSTSLGTIWALAERGQPFDLLWIDAHGDFNILETSPTGNPHGMVLSLATGLFPGTVPTLIGPERLHLWGVRDLDPGERVLLERHRVEVLGPDQVRAEREQLIGRLRPDVYLSFDIDSVDPTEAPGTGVPVPGGFSRAEALELVAAIARQRRVLALDVVEYHPDRDRENMTGALAMDVIHTVLTEQVRILSGRPFGQSAAAGD